VINLWLLKRYQPSALAAFSLTTPLFGVLATATVLGEPIDWTLGASALLVAGGIAVATLLPEPARQPAAAIARPAGPEASP